MAAYYNENDPNAAAWLRELIARDLIAPGDVDTRSIVDVRPDDLAGYVQCHFFAGIGGWSLALRNAGWADDRPAWTGSCPCQPFSTSGKGEGFSDPRHLWPAFYRLIGERRPDVVLGEQVASPVGLAWLDLVHHDLEGSGYAVGAVDTCAAGFGAPHIRQRLYWSALLHRGLSEPHDPIGRADSSGRNVGNGSDAGWSQGSSHAQAGGRNDRLDSLAHGLVGLNGCFSHAVAGPRGLDDDDGDRAGQAIGRVSGSIQGADGGCVRPGPTNAFWRDADWLQCHDGGWRPAEPGTFPLAHGVPARLGRLRGYGNAIVAPQAAAFVEAMMEAVS